MQQSDAFHYPPQLFDLLIDTIPVLCKSKKSVILFFRGAGIQENLIKDVSDQVIQDPDSINKYEISRTIITRINEKKDQYIRERRELLKRVVEFESFSTCWPNDQYKAEGLVAAIRKIVDVKDAFTRMQQEKDKVQEKHREEYTKKVEAIRARSEKIDIIKKEFYALFADQDPNKRGIKLEGILNSLFSVHGILIREAFTRKGENGEGILEQIDGVIEIDHQIYLVEMKWRKDKIGGDDIFAHLGRIYHRTNAQGIFISASGYSPSGITAAKEAVINKAVLALTELQEFVDILENEKDLIQYFRSKIHAAIIDKNPFVKP